MMKNKKLMLVVTSLVTLLPSAVTCVLWDRLVGIINEKYVSGTGGIMPALVAIPFILLAFQWICLFISSKDPKNKEQNGKLVNMVMWIIPFLSVFVYLMMLNALFDDARLIEMIVSPVLGVFMIVIGNYMPKTTRNSTMGIKIKWTLENDENWYATHRFAGKIQVVCGAIICFGAFLPVMWQMAFLLAVLIFGMVLPTTLYSYLYYKKQVADGTYVKNTENMLVNNKKFAWVTAILIFLIFIGCTFVMFTGDIDITLGEEALDIKASFGEDITVEYSKIDGMEYRETKDIGVRLIGFNSARLSTGNFKNDEFGSYTCYAYNGTDSCIILTVEGKTVLVNAADEEATKALYEELASRLGK